MQEQDNTSSGGFLEFIMAIIAAITGGNNSETTSPAQDSQQEVIRQPGFADVLGKSFGGVTLSTSTDIPDNTSGGYQLYAQMTGTEKTPEGYNVAVGNLILVAPDGTQQVFDFNSGAGRNLQNNMLPGLCADINGSREGNATFEIDNASLQVDSKALPAGMLADDGRGEWLKLISDRTQTQRGAASADESGSFGIHTDGRRTGTAGCIGMNEHESAAFFSALQQIPEHLRPKQLVVLSQKTPETAQNTDIGSGLPARLQGRLHTPRLP